MDINIRKSEQFRIGRRHNLTPRQPRYGRPSLAQNIAVAPRLITNISSKLG